MIQMGWLKEEYLKHGCNPKRFERSPSYLSSLFLYAALEIDERIIGSKTPYFYGSVEDLSRVLEKLQLKDSDTGHNRPKVLGYHFEFYLPLNNAMNEGSNRKIDTIAKLALEMRLLKYEVDEFPNLPEDRLKLLRDFFLEVHEQYRKGDNLVAND